MNTFAEWQLGAGLALLVLLGCSAEHDSEGAEATNKVEELRIADMSLSLREEGGQCYLSYQVHEKSEENLLALPPPCRFARGHAGEVRVERFPAGEEFVAVVIVIGGSLERDPLTPITMRDDCGDRWQGILVDSQMEVALSARIGNGMACAGVGLDEKAYRLFLDHR